MRTNGSSVSLLAFKSRKRLAFVLLPSVLAAGCAVSGRPAALVPARRAVESNRDAGRRIARVPVLSPTSGFREPSRLTRQEPDDSPRDPRLALVTDADGPEPGRIVVGERSAPSEVTGEVRPRSGEPILSATARDEESPGFHDGVRVSQAPSPSRPRPEPRAADSDDDAGAMKEDQEDTDLNRSRAGRRGEGGGPTRSEEDDDDDNDEDEFKSDLLVKALGLENSPISVFGWLQGSFTGNQYRPKNGENFGVNPNSSANQFLFQQLYFVVEKRLDPKDADDYGFGFRVDSLTGSDWKQFHMTGLFDGVFTSKYFGYDPVQFYGEVHLPWLTEGGIDVKGGRFYSLPGYEDAAAPGRPLNSTTYMFGYGQPYTHFGVMTNWHVTDRLNLFNGAVNGWDRWIDRNFRWGYAGGLVWDAPNDRTNLSVTLNVGPNQFPWFFKAGYQNEPNGVPPPPFLAGRRNLLYNKSNAVLFTETLIHEATDKLTLIAESDQGYESNIASFGPGGSSANGQWYGLAGFMLYTFNEKWTGVARAEGFRDVNGTRTGYNDTYYETTLGLIVKPRSWLWLRPEVRWDWAVGEPVYNDERSKHQFTYGFDAIFLF